MTGRGGVSRAIGIPDGEGEEEVGGVRESEEEGRLSSTGWARRRRDVRLARTKVMQDSTMELLLLEC